MNLDHLSPEADRKLTVAYWLCMLAITTVDIITVYTGDAPGLLPGRHPPEYLYISNVAIFLLISVIPVLRLLDLVHMPWWFNLMLTFDVYLYIVSLTCGFYKDESISWWGFLGHTCSSMSLCALCFLALCIVKKHSPVDVSYGHNIGFLVLLFFVSIAFGGIWEVMEGYIDIVAGTSYMSYGIFDSLQDLEADTLGTTIMCIAAGLLLRTRTPEDIADSTRVRKPGTKRA